MMNTTEKTRLAKGETYHKLRLDVEWYYYNTDLSLQKIANHFEISYGKASGMLDRKFPKYYLEYMEFKNEQTKNQSNP